MNRLGMFVLAASLAGCAEMQGLVNKASDKAVEKGYMSGKQAEGVKKTSAAFRKSAEEISESEEYFIGRAVAAQVLARYQALDDSALNDYLQKVLQGVAQVSDRPATFKGYHVQVLDSDEPNAFAAPGGFIFVTKGLLKLVENEEQLAAVLAHEVAHVSNKHGLKTIQTARLTAAFTVLGTEAAKNYGPEEIAKLTESFEGAIDDVVNKLVVNGYSRDKEFEADKFGAMYAQRANYDPAALGRFLGKLERTPPTGGLFKTHPTGGQRIAELNKSPLQASASYKKSAERDKRFGSAVAARLK